MKVALKENNNNKHAFRESDDVQIQKYTMINISKYILRPWEWEHN